MVSLQSSSCLFNWFVVLLLFSAQKLAWKCETRSSKVVYIPEGRVLKMRIHVSIPLPTFGDPTSHSKMSGFQIFPHPTSHCTFLTQGGKWDKVSEKSEMGGHIAIFTPNQLWYLIIKKLQVGCGISEVRNQICENLHPISHLATEIWEVGSKWEFSFLIPYPYPLQLHQILLLCFSLKSSAHLIPDSRIFARWI